MLINGEKFACEACVRGHRVSNCQHNDRPLQHIAKKGRPVSQCQHCRTLRKSRSAHTKCDCGEKMFKCAHLKTTHEGHSDSCCCNHGGRCTCCHKKEHSHLETVPESVSPKDGPTPAKGLKGGIRARRRATVPSESSMLSFDEHGNRKTSVNTARASLKYEPYSLNRQNSTYSLHSTSPTDTHGCNSPSSSTVSFPERRQSKSEAASPLMTGSSSFTALNGQLPPLDLTSVHYSGNGDNWYTWASEFEQPLFSAGAIADPVDWSHYHGLEFTNKATDFAPSNYSQPQSFGGYDIGGSEQPPTLTTSTSTSGEPSEIDDLISSSFEDLDNASCFQPGTVSSGFDLEQISQSLCGGSTDFSTLDYDDFKMMKAGTSFLPTPASLAGDEPVLVSSAPTTMGNFSHAMADEDTALWMSTADYCHGLPSGDFQLPLTDSPDGSSMATFWGAQ